jgi:hypothetical protein
MMSARLCINSKILFFLICLNVTQAIASPWNLQKNQIQTISTYRYYSTSDYFDIDGERRPKLGSFNKNELQLSVDYGLSEKWNIGAEMFVSRQSDNQNGDNIIEFVGINRADLRLNYQLFRNAKYAVALQPSVSLPPYYFHKYYAFGTPSFEKGAGEIAILAGYNFQLFQQNHWLASKIAYRHRLSDKLQDQYSLGMQAGLRLNDKIAIIPELNYTGLTSNAPKSFTTIAGDNNYDLLNTQISVAYQLNPSATLQIGAFRHLIGNNAGAGGGGLISLWLNW